MKQNQASHSGAQGVKGVEEVRKGTTKDRSGGAGGGGGVGKSTGRKGCRDKSHYNINHRPGHRAQGLGVPALEVRNLRRRMMGRRREETREEIRR